MNKDKILTGFLRSLEFNIYGTHVRSTYEITADCYSYKASRIFRDEDNLKKYLVGNEIDPLNSILE